MKSLFWKDKNRRLIYSKTEKKQWILKYILNNLNISKEKRNFIYTELQSLTNLNSITKIHNRCIFTNRSRGIYKKFKISRMFFKRDALYGFLMGVKKASW